MIDDEFSPTAVQWAALGYLFEQSQLSPLQPAMRESEIYRRVYGLPAPNSSQAWLNELQEYHLIHTATNAFRVGDKAGDPPVDVCLTAAGIYFVIGHTDDIAQNAFGLTMDVPEGFLDGAASLRDYYSPEHFGAPTADGVVSFDHNHPSHVEALRAIDAVTTELASEIWLARRILLPRIKGWRSSGQSESFWSCNLAEDQSSSL